MASILDFLGTHKGAEFISMATEITSESREKVTTALGMGLPILIGAIKMNITSPEGMETLNRALKENRNAEIFLDNINGVNSSEIKQEGSKILDNILGSNKETIFTTIGSTLQMKESSVANILKMASFLLMNILSFQKHKDNITFSELESLVNSIMGASSQFDASLIETFLEKSKDGSIIKDVEGLVLGSDENRKKDGGILGGMLGGK
jgi:hypothetical protein